MAAKRNRAGGAPAPDGPTALRGPVLTWTGDPFEDDPARVLRFERDAIVGIAAGVITHFGPADAVAADLPPGTAIERFGRDQLIVPGLIDCHVHYAQTQIIGACGEPLLTWLQRYTFAAEQQCADAAHAREAARVFVGECLRAGTTTAAVHGTVHPHSVDALFAEAERAGMRVIAGKVLMDRNAPPALLDTPQRAYDESKALIARWHGRGRALYAITPRFAATSTPAQLEVAGALWREHPGTYVQSHIAESEAEVAWIEELYPDEGGYLDVYGRRGLLGPRAIYGHGIWLTEDELRRCHETGTAIAHGPTSNAFLGSGLLDVVNAKDAARPVRVGLATDIGAGTSFSMLRTMHAAYATARLRGRVLSAAHLLWLATRGAAQALYLDDRIGSIAPGMEADLAVLDLAATPLLAYRMRFCDSLDDTLGALITLGDDRAVRATYVGGRAVHRRAP